VYKKSKHTHREGPAMRTNVVIDDALMEMAQKHSGITTKKGAIEAGLKLLIQLNSQKDIRALRGTIQWIGNLEEMRSLR
jgi:Arc/MetJ family transcription regulator